MGFTQSYLLEYDVTLNVLYRTGHLTVNTNENSYYCESMIKEKKENDTKDSEDTTLNQTIFIGNGTNKKRYQIYKQKKDTLYNIDFIDNKEIKTHEKFPKFHWEIHNDTMKIDRYSCHKATTYFRGRNYIAWFSTEIPIQLGPWKFNGLPGAILQVYDETGSYSWTATKISLTSTNTELETNHKLQLISLKEFVIENEKSKQIRSDRIMLKFAERGSEVIKREFNRGRETKFEWEEKQKQD